METIYKVSAKGSNRYSLFLTLAEAQASAAARSANTGKEFVVGTVQSAANVR